MNPEIKKKLIEIGCHVDQLAVMEWFRQTHKLYPAVRTRNSFNENYFYRVVDWTDGKGEILFESNYQYGFAEAKSLCLNKLIEIVKQRSHE
jgi:hypothetical protein